MRSPSSQSETVHQVPFSGHRELSNIAAGMPGVIRLEVGQPNFPTPAHINAAGCQAINDGWNFYTPTAGLTSLRERLLEKLPRVNGIEATLEQILCGVGGSGVISSALAAICNPGDTVLVPDPGWPQCRLMIASAHAQAVAYPCPQAAGYLPDLDALEAAITPRTRVLLINSPSNPTGAVWPPAALQQLGEVAARHDLWIVSDECYDQMMMDGPAAAPSMWASGDPERVVSCFSFSKTYSMCGWRIGYAVVPTSLTSSMLKVLEGCASGSCTISQKAAEAALDGPQDCVQEMVEAYRRRRDLVIAQLQSADLPASASPGAFYVLADISSSGVDSRTFCFRLLHERKVAIAPGSAFGEISKDMIRISLASSEADLAAGIKAVSEAVDELRSAVS
jgi:aspartate aminotransferase